MDIGKLVPQLYFDLIGRVCPGILLLSLAFVSFNDADAVSRILQQFAFQENSPTSLILLGIILASYLLGILIGAFGYAYDDNRCQWCPKSVQSSGDAADTFEYDSIQIHDPVMGLRLGKLSAERHLCNVVIFGIPLLSTLLIMNRPSGVLNGPSLVLFLCFTWGAAYLLKLHLFKRYSQSLSTFQKILSTKSPMPIGDQAQQQGTSA
jgi:hypothetical protein